MIRLTSLALVALAACPALAQTITQPQPVPAPVAAATLPTYIAGGAAYNQLASPKFNLWVSAIAPMATSAGLYTSTTADLVPALKTDPSTGKSAYILQATVRQGIHKVLYNKGNIMLLLGGDGGLSFSQSQSGSGTSVGGAGSFTGTFVYQINSHLAAMVPIRGLWTNLGGWNLVPEIGITWKP